LNARGTRVSSFPDVVLYAGDIAASTATSLNGWQHGAYWLSQAATFTFAAAGTHTLRIQTREDGVQIDQIVLSPSTYLTAAPGGPTASGVIVPN